jgi:predicted metalloprotease with PDZ domain
LQWNSTFQDATFRFQLADDSLFTTTMLDNVTQNQVTTVPEGLLIEGINYYWRVHTTLNDETSPWSDVWKFSTLNTGLNRQLQANKMLSISPNPASSSVKISFIVAGQNVNKEPVTIEIMNSVGTVSLKMEEKKVSPGSYDITLGTENLKPGIYYCRLRTSNQTEVRKLVIAR